MSVRAVLAAASFVALLAGAPPARAQGGDDAAAEAASTAARARYNAGTRAFADKRFVEAALNFEAAAAEKPSPVALYTAALSWEQANVPDRAADDYGRALAAPGLPADKAALARERIASLEGVLGAVAVSGPEGARVQLDANTELPVPATLHGAAGVHSLSVRAAGKPIQRRPLVLERGKTAKLDLATEPPPTSAEQAAAPPPPPPAVVPPPPAAPASDWKVPVGFTAIGVGGALLLSGVVLGSEAIGARDAYRGSPTQSTLDHATELQTWTNVAFVAGGVFAAAGIALVVWPSPKPAAPEQAALGPPAGRSAGSIVEVVPAPDGVLLRGAF